MKENNVDLARHGYEAALRGDLDAVGALLDPAIRWHGGEPTAPGACRNREEALEFMRKNQQAGGGPGELVDVIDAGDRVVVIMRRTDETGLSSIVANVTTFRNGKVVEMVHYPDARDALRSAGVES